VITAGVLQRDALEPVLDARALNIVEPHLIGEELADLRVLSGLVDRLRGSDRTVAEREVSEIAGICREVALTNHQEGEREQHAAATLDSLVCDLHDGERNGSPVDRLITAKGIARRLREPLDVLLSPAGHDARAFIRAAWAVRDVLDHASLAQIRSAGLLSQLGPRKHQLLVGLARLRRDTATPVAAIGGRL
jgi:hypothetical protein